MHPDGKSVPRLPMAHAGVLLALVCACGTQPADPNALPSWISAYPGSPPQAPRIGVPVRNQRSRREGPRFLRAQLARNGVHKEARGGGDYGGFLSAADDSHSRNVMIEIRSDKGASEVTITPVQKK